MGTAPLWLSLLMLAIQDAPAVASAIQISQLPPMNDEQLAMLQNAMNQAGEKFSQDIEKKFPHA